MQWHKGVLMFSRPITCAYDESIITASYKYLDLQLLITARHMKCFNSFEMKELKHKEPTSLRNRLCPIFYGQFN